jgi:hypothetical protein
MLHNHSLAAINNSVQPKANGSPVKSAASAADLASYEEETYSEWRNSMNKKQDEVSIIRSSAAEYLTFVASTGGDEDSIEMRYEDENIWLTQKMMAVLYDVDVRTTNEHIKEIYNDGEQVETSTIRKFRIVQTEGGRQISRNQDHYKRQTSFQLGRAFFFCQGG